MRWKGAFRALSFFEGLLASIRGTFIDWICPQRVLRLLWHPPILLPTLYIVYGMSDLCLDLSGKWNLTSKSIISHRRGDTGQLVFEGDLEYPLAVTLASDVLFLGNVSLYARVDTTNDFTFTIDGLPYAVSSHSSDSFRTTVTADGDHTVSFENTGGNITLGYFHITSNGGSRSLSADNSSSFSPPFVPTDSDSSRNSTRVTQTCTSTNASSSSSSSDPTITSNITITAVSKN